MAKAWEREEERLQKLRRWRYRTSREEFYRIVTGKPIVDVGPPPRTVDPRLLPVLTRLELYRILASIRRTKQEKLRAYQELDYRDKQMLGIKAEREWAEDGGTVGREGIDLGDVARMSVEELEAALGKPEQEEEVDDEVRDSLRDHGGPD